MNSGAVPRKSEQGIGNAIGRALAVRPTVRLISVLMWSSFLGAVCTMAALVMMPEGWPLPPETMADDGLLFLVAWVLSMIPSTLVAVLLSERRRER